MKKKFYYFLKCSAILIAFFFVATICFAQTGVWEELKPQDSPSPRLDFGMAEIGDGKVLIFGGDDGVKIVDDTWLYDYHENNWIQINCEVHPDKRYDHKMARITKNKVLLFGGLYVNYTDTWIFDLETLSWTEMKPMIVPQHRQDFCMAQLMDNKVLIYGGMVFDSSQPGIIYPQDTWVYDLNDNNWTIMPFDLFIEKNPPVSQGAMTAQLDSGKILFYGGWNLNPLDETWLFDYTKQKWSKLSPKSNAVPIGHSSMAKINKNQVAFWGGDLYKYDSSGNYNQLWRFNLSDSSWKNMQTTLTPNGRFLHQIVNFGNNKIFLFGGHDNTKGSTFNDSWLYTLLSDEVEENQFENVKNQNYFLIQNDKARIHANFIGFCNYKLYDIYGKVLKEFQNIEINNYIDFDASGLSNGVYFLVVQGGKKTEVIRLMVAR
jgi:hypothetical protein